MTYKTRVPFNPVTHDQLSFQFFQGNIKILRPMTTPATAHALNATPHRNPAGPGPARQDDTLAYYVGMAQRARLFHAQAQAFSGVLPSPLCGNLHRAGRFSPQALHHPSVAAIPTAVHQSRNHAQFYVPHNPYLVPMKGHQGIPRFMTNDLRATVPRRSLSNSTAYR